MTSPTSITRASPSLMYDAKQMLDLPDLLEFEPFEDVIATTSDTMSMSETTTNDNNPLSFCIPCAIANNLCSETNQDAYRWGITERRC